MDNIDDFLFEGFVKKIKFNNDENFYILEVQNENKENNILQCYSQNIRVGDYFKATGNWIYKKGSNQFKSDNFQILQPTKKESILEYLSSGIIKGIGKGTAKKIVELFGEDSLNILDQKPELLLRVPRLGQKNLTKIINSWLEVKPSEQIVSELVRLGFKDFEAVKIYKIFNEDSLTILKTYPYNISYKIRSIDFKTVDFIVLEMGFPEDSPIRIKAAINFFCHEVYLSGDCLINKIDVLKKVKSYLKNVDYQLIENSLEDGIKKNQFHRIYKDSIEYIQTEFMFNYEMELAKRLYQLNNHQSKENIKKIEKINFVENKIKYTEEQTNAIKVSLNNKISIITGKPGVGKTTVLKEIISQFELLKKDILLCAPTGKAAQKMTESTGIESATIHRLLEFNPIKDGFSLNESNPLKLDVIIIDEASMIDIYLMVNLLRAVPLDAQIIIIGDIGQLPSVSAGAVLRDIINSNNFEVARIEKIQRQKGTSSIVLNAHSIDKGKFEYFPSYNSNNLEDFYFLNTNSDSETLYKMENIIKTKIKKSFNFTDKDIQILAATHQGELGTENLNKRLQEILNNKKESFSIKKGSFNYKEEDKVIQIVNNYEKLIFNGDTGIIKIINENGIYIEFDNGKTAEYTIKEMEELLPAYVITGHKSQGSEYPVVIIPLPQIFTQVIDRSWIYTAITRGKSLVIVLGSREVLKRAIESEKSRNRNTHLKEKIIEIFNLF